VWTQDFKTTAIQPRGALSLWDAYYCRIFYLTLFYSMYFGNVCGLLCNTTCESISLRGLFSNEPERSSITIMLHLSLSLLPLELFFISTYSLCGADCSKYSWVYRMIGYIIIWLVFVSLPAPAMVPFQQCSISALDMNPVKLQRIPGQK
jgi:hypothetical protein